MSLGEKVKQASIGPATIDVRDWRSLDARKTQTLGLLLTEVQKQ